MSEEIFSCSVLSISLLNVKALFEMCTCDLASQQESKHMMSYLENIDVKERPQPFILSLYVEDILKPQQVLIHHH